MIEEILVLVPIPEKIFPVRKEGPETKFSFSIKSPRMDQIGARLLTQSPEQYTGMSVVCRAYLVTRIADQRERVHFTPVEGERATHQMPVRNDKGDIFFPKLED